MAGTGAQIQQQIDNYANNGGFVQIGEGEWIIDKPLTVNHSGPCSIVGTGPSTILTSTFDSGPLLHFTQNIPPHDYSVHRSVRDLVLRAQTPAQVNKIGILAHLQGRLNLSRVHFTNFATGLQAEGGSESEMTDCYFKCHNCLHLDGTIGCG